MRGDRRASAPIVHDQMPFRREALLGRVERESRLPSRAGARTHLEETGKSIVGCWAEGCVDVQKLCKHAKVSAETISRLEEVC